MAIIIVSAAAIGSNGRGHRPGFLDHAASAVQRAAGAVYIDPQPQSAAVLMLVHCTISGQQGAAGCLGSVYSR